MEVLIAMSVLGVVAAAYLGYRVLQGIRVYWRFRGTRLLTCPETHTDAVIEVAARSMGRQAIMDEPCLRVSQCSRWPMRRECGQDCLRQIEGRSPELRFCAACSACNRDSISSSHATVACKERL
jgi:hypothetical protein